MARSYPTNKDGEPISLEIADMAGARKFSPSTARNRDVVRDAFIELMPRTGTIIEVGCGSGEHSVHIAKASPDLYWMGGDPDEASRKSLAAWIAFEKLTNMAKPHSINVTEANWDDIKTHSVSGIMSANMVHIAPFSAATGLFTGANQYLEAGGKLFLYGPFSRHGEHIAPSNAEFDRSLKSRNSAWGVRDLENDLIPLGKEHGLSCTDICALPANNFAVVFTKV